MDSNDRKALVCFTAAFPFGLKETFFENELPYLADRFDKVFILPRYNPYEISTRINELPSNVDYFIPKVPKSKIKRIIKGLVNNAPLSFYIADFFKFKVFQSNRRFVAWFNSLLVFRINYKWQKRVILDIDKHFNGNLLLYSYWAEAPFFLSHYSRSLVKVLRMHGTDFYLKANRGYLPLRQLIYDSTDLLLPISDDIARTLRKHYRVEDSRIFISRLGISNPEGKKSINRNFDTKNSEKGVIRIVSCSRVEPVKRVHLILEALLLYSGSNKIEWHHFGDGSLFDDLKKHTANLIGNVHVELHGWKTQKDIFSFYQENLVTWFVNVSESEGIPVSIMEAMSFGIPVIATDVGATSEIIDDSNGHLITKDVSLKNLLMLMLDSKNDKYQSRRIAALQTWERHYQAEENYTLLGGKLASILDI